jgi:putative phosphoesterase
MRIAIVSDIHGNITALDAVLADLRLTSPDVIFHGGDLAANGPRPAEVVDRIRDLGWSGVRGNTDEMLWDSKGLVALTEKSPKLQSLRANFEEMIPWTCALLGEERMQWLRTLPKIQRSGDLALLHASPNNLWKGPLHDAGDSELLNVYRSLEAPLVVYGHIHRSFVRLLEGMTVANSGSLSLSYDGDPRASYLLLDGAKANIRRVEYDREKEVEILLRSGLPHTAWLCRILRASRYQPPD